MAPRGRLQITVVKRNGEQRHVGIQRGGGFCGCHARGRLLRLLVTGPGAFRVRLTQVLLHHLRLSTGEEHLPQVALIAVPTDVILVSLTGGRRPAPIWGGITIGAGEIMTLGAGQRLHTRTEGPCRWGAIWLPTGELVRYGGALTGTAVAVPAAALWWRLRPAMIGDLRHLHSAAVRLVERGSRAMIDAAAAHGLEQRLIHPLVECLSKGSVIKSTAPHVNTRASRSASRLCCRLSGAISSDCRDLLSTSPREPSTYTARNSSAWARPSTFAAAGCSWCTTRESFVTRLTLFDARETLAAL